MWIELTVDHILEGLTSPESSAVRTAAVGVSQSDPAGEIIYGVTREIRARVGACENNSLGEGLTIPDELKDTAVAMCVFRLCKRVPAKILLSEHRVRAYDDALTLLSAVANCKFLLEQPTVESDEEFVSNVPTFSGRCRQFGPSQQDGL